MSQYATFRLARFEDFTAMLELALHLKLPTDEIAQVLSGKGNKRDVWLLAEFDGVLRAFVYCKRGRQANPLLKMVLFAVSPDWLEHGFGWAMLRYSETIAKSYSARLIWLDGMTQYNWQTWGLPKITGREKEAAKTIYSPTAAPSTEAKWFATGTSNQFAEAA